MTPQAVIRSFRQQLLRTRVMRVLLLSAAAGLLLWSATLPDPLGRQLLFLLSLGGVLLWVVFVLQILRQTRDVHASTILLATGQLDRAEQWLDNCLSRFSMSTQVKLIALQQLAVLSLRRNAPADVVAICREVLRFPVKRARHVWINACLMLTEGLLDLDRVAEAYEALRPVYDQPLSLVERMKLLPVQLRYELTSDHPASAVQQLREKVRLAELFPSLQASFVHALLAEACRRLGKQREYEYLRERAGLYHDLEPLAKRYPLIAPMVTS